MASLTELLGSYCSAPDSGIAPRQQPKHAGLFISGSDKSVPLRLRDVVSKVFCDTGVSDTTESFAFVADEDVSVVFIFPLPPRAAVYKLTASIGDRTLVTSVKARDDARSDFETAVGQGHAAVLAEKQDSSQIYSLELGNLAAMEEAVIELSYVRLLDSVGGALEWVHTATWVPPYLGSMGDTTRGVAQAQAQNPKFASSVAYTLTYDVQLVSQSDIQSVESIRPISVTQLGTGEGVPAGPAGSMAENKGKRVQLHESVSDPSKDLTLLIELAPLSATDISSNSRGSAQRAAAGVARASVQLCKRPGVAGAQAQGQGQGQGAQGDAEGARSVVLATFTPQAPLEPSDAPVSSSSLPPTEVVLVVDCSGSMEGRSIEQAREAALYFVKDLPAGQGVCFNVVAFGSTYISWQASWGCVPVTAESTQQAVVWVQKHIHADMGGTEILGTLQAVYAHTPAPGFTRTILFLTDGGISGGEEAQVLQLVGHKSAQSPPSPLHAGIASLKSRLLGSRAADSLAPAPVADTATGVATRVGQGARAGSGAVPTVLCLGIGHGVHRGLLDSMASQSGGVAQYVVDGESIAAKVALLRKTALAGAGVVWNPRLLVGGAVGVVHPFVLPPRLFPGEPLHTLVELPPGVDVRGVSLELKGEQQGAGAGAPRTPWSLPLPLQHAPLIQGEAYSVLAGMCTVVEALSGKGPLHIKHDGTPLPNPPSPDKVKAAVVEVAVREGLVTPFTAAVGYLVTPSPLDPSQVRRQEVPLAVPSGAIHFRGAGDAGGGYSPMQGFTMQHAALPLAQGPFMGRRLLGSGGSMLMKCAAATQSVLCGAAPAPAPAMFSFAAPGAAPQLDRSAAVPMCAAPAMASFEGPPAGIAADFASGASSAEYASLPTPAAEVQEAASSSGNDSGATGKAAGPMSVSQVVSLLNLARGVEGVWRAQPELLQALCARATSADKAGHGDDSDNVRAKVSAALAAKPAALSDDQWASVLALAFLNKYASAERGVWQDMEGKAAAYLRASWPQANPEAQAQQTSALPLKSVGIMVLAAMKLV